MLAAKKSTGAKPKVDLGTPSQSGDEARKQ